MIQLKDFQEKLVSKLLQFTNPNYGVNELVVKAPTGSGKTICLLSWIEQYLLTTHDNVAFVWFTPGAGELEEQSQDKARLFPTLQAQSVEQALLNGFEAGSVTFINYERVVGKKAKAMLNDSEHDNLLKKINNAFLQDRHFILIIDEAHRNDTKKARDIIAHFNASKTVRVSATINDPKTPNNIEFYEVNEESVIASGLITKSVVVNENIDPTLEIENEFEVLFDAAEKKRKEILQAFHDNGVQDINPLVLVQLPDNSSSEVELVSRIENFIENTLNKSYANGKLGIWLSDKKKNHFDVQLLENSVEYLIIKQAIATGWDAPRAKILIKIRENMGEAFTIQTIGRIRRMPQPNHGHYNVDVLDNAYLYTFDSDFLIGAFAQGDAVVPTPILKLKDKAKKLHLVSERVKDLAETHSEKAILQNLYKGLKRSWNLTDDPQLNRSIVENRGLVITRTTKKSYKQGRFNTIRHADKLEDVERIMSVSYRENRLDLIHAFHELDRVVHVPISKVEAILKRLFLKDGRMKKEKLLLLDAQEWTAFIMNYWRTLREEFRQVEIYHSQTLDLKNIQENDFSIPYEERYTYNPNIPLHPVETNVYLGYSTAIVAARLSLVERLLERYLEDHEDIVDFVYKNGDKGEQYFSVTYETLGALKHFYPDFIIQMKNGDLYIIETKGGIKNNGDDKNIDPYSEVKYQALKDYASRHNVKWAFVRDYNETLWFLNEGEWIDDVRTDSWKPIKDLFI